MEIVGLPPKRDFETELRTRAGSGSAYDARIAGLLLDLLDALRGDAIGPRVFVSYHLDRELWLHYRGPNDAHCLITVTLDRPDYGPLENGLPRFHYRMTYRITGSTHNRDQPTIEQRARSVESAVEFVWQAIRETRMLP